jgi:predicted dehydrogenase/sugar phosphate isomerase/epimerase
MSKTLPIAVQVYSVREEAERDFAGTMKKLGEMGYDGVELAGLYGKSAEEIRDSIKAAGLTAISAHVSYDELAGDLEKTLQDYETIGCRYIVIPWLGEDRRFGTALYEETIKEIPVISEGCKKHGMTLLYHNHDFEFAKTLDGTYALDQLYAEVPADVLGAEPDTCWIKVGGPDPSEWLKKYSGRCPLVHVKDFRRKADGVDLLALGEGEQDFPTLVKTAKECGAQWLVIEQDDHPYGTPMGDMKKSLNYLKELGKESDMTKIIKAGVVGCGGIANGKHFPAIKKNGKIELVAFCDLIKERAEKAKEEYGTPDARVYTDYTELVKEDVDVVYVLTPNNAHAPVSIAAMKAGKHVMCEKPMAKTYAEAKEMVKTAKETGKILTIGYQNRYRADSQYLKSACEADELGEIYYAKAHAIRRRAVPTWGVFIDEEKQGGGPLIDIGTHALDLTLWMMNNYEPASVTGSTYRKLADQTQTGNAWGDWDPKKFTVEDSAFGFIKMKNGATIVLEASWALNSLDVDEAKTSLCGTKAGADMKDGLRINRVHHGRQCVEKPDLGAGGVAFYDGTEEKPADIEAEVFYNAVTKGTPLTVEPEQALVVTQLLEAIYESAKTGKTIYFD